MRFQLGLIISALLVSTSATADAPKYGELPKGAFSSPPDDGTKPKSIPAKEKVEGFYVAAQKPFKGIPASKQGPMFVTIVGTKADADKIANGERFDDDEIDSCFTEGRSAATSEDDDADAVREWDSNSQRVARLWPRQKGNTMGGVTALHSEKLVEKESGATLETVDVWVDPDTRGVRLIGKRSLPLKLVATAFGDFKVYAARDERPGTKPQVEFVFARTQTLATSAQGRAGMLATPNGGRASVGSGCRHLRIALPVETKGGVSANISATLELPNLDGKKQKEKDENEVRIRDLQTSVSVSKSTRDKEPLVSVSFGWSNRETIARVGDSERD